MFTPIKINGLTLKNRLVMTPMGCGLAETDGGITDGFIAYYEERAKGGAGLLYTEVACVSPVHGRRAFRQIHLTDESQLPTLKKLTERIHEYGCAIFPQLLHPGVMTSNAANDGEKLVGPSGIASAFMPPQSVRTITKEEIHALPKEFAAGALLAKKAGFDGVEIHGAHHYLLHQFLSPHFNHRTDEYGGNFENRCRLLLEIVDAVREAVGQDYPVSVRISAEDYMGEESVHLEDSIRLSRLLEKHGVDMISVSAGGTENGRSHSIEPVSYPQGWRKHLAKAIKNSVSLPVLATTVIRDPEFAQSLLDDGCMDLIGMGRSFLADPQWPEKARNHRDREIRKCISCLRCIDSIKTETPICCSVNPECGMENRVSEMLKNGNKRLCLVVGGGPAGMECARVLAERGFCVKLYERSANLGGQIWLASRIPGKEKMQWFIEHEEEQLRKLGVDILVRTTATAENLLQQDPWLIVDATGSDPYLPDHPGMDSPLVTTSTAVLSGDCQLKDKCVVVVGTGMTGLETAEYLAHNGNAITILSGSDRILRDRSVAVRDILRYLETKNAVILPNRSLTEIREDRILYKRKDTGEELELPCDKIVICQGVRSNGRIAQEIGERHGNVIVIGDAANPGRILEAVRAGYHAAVTV